MNDNWLEGRRVKIDPDGKTWMISAKGDPDNFDFFPEKPSPDMAVAGNFGMGIVPDTISEAYSLGGSILLFLDDGVPRNAIVGNPCDGGKIQKAALVAERKVEGGDVT